MTVLTTASLADIPEALAKCQVLDKPTNAFDYPHFPERKQRLRKEKHLSQGPRIHTRIPKPALLISVPPTYAAGHLSTHARSDQGVYRETWGGWVDVNPKPCRDVASSWHCEHQEVVSL